MFEAYCSFPNLGYVSFWCRVLAVETEKGGDSKATASIPQSIVGHPSEPTVPIIESSGMVCGFFSLSHFTSSSVVGSWRKLTSNRRAYMFFKLPTSPPLCPHYIVSKRISKWVPHDRFAIRDATPAQSCNQHHPTASHEGSTLYMLIAIKCLTSNPWSPWFLLIETNRHLLLLKPMIPSVHHPSPCKGHACHQHNNKRAKHSRHVGYVQCLTKTSTSKKTTCNSLNFHLSFVFAPNKSDVQNANLMMITSFGDSMQGGCPQVWNCSRFSWWNRTPSSSFEVRQKFTCFSLVCLGDSTNLQNISQIGQFPQAAVRKKNIWNHRLETWNYIHVKWAGLFFIATTMSSGCAGWSEPTTCSFKVVTNENTPRECLSLGWSYCLFQYRNTYSKQLHTVYNLQFSCLSSLSHRSILCHTPITMCFIPSPKRLAATPFWRNHAKISPSEAKRLAKGILKNPQVASRNNNQMVK